MKKNIIEASCHITRRDVCAIVITFHPDGQAAARITHLCAQVDRLIIVDNGSNAAALNRLQRSALRDRVHLIRNRENMGVAAALNQGIRAAGRLGYDWVLTMDQDSLAYPELVQNLAIAYDACPFRDNVAIVATNRQDVDGIVAFADDSGGHWHDAQQAITSGSLISFAAFEQAGPFREDLFIDMIDIEYCHRLRLAGFKIICSPRIGMRHTIGNRRRIRRVGRKTIMPYNYPPARSYYMTRNTLLLARRPDFWKEPRWAWGRLTFLFKYWVLTLLFERDRAVKARHIGLGVLHAAKSRTGRLPSPATASGPAEPRK